MRVCVSCSERERARRASVIRRAVEALFAAKPVHRRRTKRALDRVQMFPTRSLAAQPQTNTPPLTLAWRMLAKASVRLLLLRRATQQQQHRSAALRVSTLVPRPSLSLDAARAKAMGKTQPTLAAFAKRAAAVAAAAPPAPAGPAVAAAAIAEAEPTAATALAKAPPGGNDDDTKPDPASKARASDQQQQQEEDVKMEEEVPTRKEEEDGGAPPAAKKPKVEAKEEEGDEVETAAAQEPPQPPQPTKKTTTKKQNKKGNSTTPADIEYAFSEPDAADFRARLLDWYDRGHRVLPWRRNPHSKLNEEGGGGNTTTTPTPKPAPPETELPAQQFAYRVWVSEIMLQQTQVATVIPYFERWVERWPTVEALAAAEEDDVNHLWAGLGYYRRARFLLRGAKHVVNELNGRFPETAEGMRAIPGVGPYTAAAVASIAFGDSTRPEAAAVDGNVVRVVSRLRAVRGDPTKLSAVHWHLAGQLLDAGRPGCHNQAMMELGATVCRPQQADCGRCPVARHCEARRRVVAWEEEEKGGEGGGKAVAVAAPLPVTAYPEKAAKAGKRAQAVAVCVLRLVRRRVKREDEGGAAAAANNNKPKAGGSLASFVRSSTGGATAAGGEAAALSAAGPAGTAYLLVQRPAQGLLAGLWECPAVVLSDEAPAAGAGGGSGASASAASAPPPARAARRAAVDGLLSRLLGDAYRRAVGAEEGGGKEAEGAAAAVPALRVVCRRDVGSAVHIFSHIRQTMHVEVLTLEVEDGGQGDFDAAALFGQQQQEEQQQPAAPPPPARRARKDDDEEATADDDEATQSDDGAAAALAAAGSSAPPALRWVTGADLADAGLTTGVRKALAMAAGSGGGGDKKGGGSCGGKKK